MSRNVINGGDLLLFITTESGDNIAVAHATSHTLEVTSETRDTSSKTSGKWGSTKPSTLSWSASCEGLASYDKTYNYNKLMDLCISQTEITLVFAGRDDSLAEDVMVDGDTYQEGKAYIGSVSLDAGRGDNATYSVSFNPAGPLETKTATTVAELKLNELGE